MACGCSGANRTTNQSPPTRRARGSEVRQPKQPVGYGDAGFTWNGPRRAPAKPASK